MNQNGIFLQNVGNAGNFRFHNKLLNHEFLRNQESHKQPAVVSEKN